MSKKIKSILLVDVDHDNQMLFQEALIVADITVNYTSACNSIDALEPHNLPDFMVIDITMPKTLSYLLKLCIKIKQILNLSFIESNTKMPAIL